jgi:uncharacterized protein YndB with AHSA1/START domain
MKDFKRTYHIPASPEEVFKALTDQAKLELWTRDKAEMSIAFRWKYYWEKHRVAGRQEIGTAMVF